MGVQKGEVHISAGESKGREGGLTQEHERDDSLRGGPSSMTYARDLGLGAQTEKNMQKKDRVAINLVQLSHDITAHTPLSPPIS